MEPRSFLFLPLGKKRFSFNIRAREGGFFVGREPLLRLAEELRLGVDWVAADGALLHAGSPVFCGCGEAAQVAGAEDALLGVIGKPSGVATAAAAFVRLSGGRIRVVCGGWKKVSPPVRTDLRQAVAIGGAGVRITDQPFMYLDKNYVRMLGGVGLAVRRARQFDPTRLVVVQLRGERGPIEREAEEALNAGAGILMIDTGRVADLRAVVREVKHGLGRESVEFAFAGGVTAEQLPAIIDAGADVVDVGRAIIDAPMLDFCLDVEVE